MILTKWVLLAYSTKLLDFKVPQDSVLYIQWIRVWEIMQATDWQGIMGKIEFGLGKGST